MYRVYLVIILLLSTYVIFGQDSGGGTSGVVDVGTVDAAATGLKDAKVKVDNLDEDLEMVNTTVSSAVVDVVESTSNVMGKLYQSYKILLANVENISEQIQTAEELKDIALDLYDFFQMVGRDGLVVEIRTLYGLDKYLNPAEQAYYIKQVYDIIEQFYIVEEWVSVVAGLNSKNGSYVITQKSKKDGGLAMTDYERLMVLKRFRYELKLLAYKFKYLVYSTMRLAEINRGHEQNFIIKKSCFDFENYNYTSIGGVKIGNTIDQKKK